MGSAGEVLKVRTGGLRVKGGRGRGRGRGRESFSRTQTWGSGLDRPASQVENYSPKEKVHHIQTYTNIYTYIWIISYGNVVFFSYLLF